MVYDSFALILAVLD